MMKRVVIVDDEMLVRVGLRTSIDWEAFGFVVEGEAKNGKEAIEKFSQSKIDLLITDIAMPEMDGLELSKYFLSINKDIHIIILTHHENFAYAKKAIDLGVNHYILKSDLNPELFSEILEKISDKEAVPEKVSKEMRYQQNMERMKKCLKDSMPPAEALEFLNDGYYMFGFADNSGMDKGEDDGAFRAIIASTLQSIKNEFYYLRNPANNKSIIIFDAKSTDFKTIISAMNTLKMNLEQILEKEIKYDYSVKHQETQLLYRQLIKHMSAGGVGEIEGVHLPFYVNKAFEFIRDNYQKDITLNDVAQYCELNPSYLSNLIRKETGITYSKYLNTIRIEEAKHLLKTTNMKVYEISMCVGIDNQYYFGKLFKELTGWTCGEYRDKSMEKEE